MTKDRATRLADALLDGDVDAVQALRAELAAALPDPEALALDDVARAALSRLRPEEPEAPLGADEVVLLRAVSGHPGSTGAELAALTGLGDRLPAVAVRLLVAGLVTSSRFARADCWSRTSRGAQELARRGGAEA